MFPKGTLLFDGKFCENVGNLCVCLTKYFDSGKDLTK